MGEYRYDARRHPPAPVLPIRLGHPNTEPALVLTALVETGADATVIPADVAAQLRLPQVDEMWIRGVGGFTQRASIHSAVVEVAGFRDALHVIALGEETLVGRDLLNRWVATLDGPRGLMKIQGPKP